MSQLVVVHVTRFTNKNTGILVTHWTLYLLILIIEIGSCKNISARTLDTISHKFDTNNADCCEKEYEPNESQNK